MLEVYSRSIAMHIFGALTFPACLHFECFYVEVSVLDQRCLLEWHGFRFLRLRELWTHC